MKYLFRATIVITAFLLITACGQVTQAPQPNVATISPNSTSIPIQTATPKIEATATIDAYVLPTLGNYSPPILDGSALPTFVIPDGTNIPFPTPNPKIPTLLPTIDPNQVYDLLQKDISIQALANINRHNIKRITGWHYGFSCSGYQWLNSNLMLLYPRTGEGMMQTFDSLSRVDLSPQRIVISLETGELLSLPYEERKDQNCDSAYWSSESGMLIVPESAGGDKVIIYNTMSDEFIKQYTGKLIDVSPSGTKILIAGDTWIDLITGKVVDFAWYPENGSPSIYVPPTVWSSDETQVFTCCYKYGNAKTGKSQIFSYNNASYGSWVRNDSYVLLQYHNYYGSNPGFIPLYDPATNTTLNLNQLAGLPSDITCPDSSVSPDREYVWVMCDGTDYLIDLANFKFTDYPNYSQVGIVWSADSKFAVIDNFDLGNSNLSILAVTSKKLTPFPIYPINGPMWHTIDHTLAYLTNQNQTLNILDVQDMSVKDYKLPSSFDNLIWSPDGNRIALVAKDGSLWQADYPNLENLEQLTQPMSAGNIQWSPDGNFIAFISGSDIYIVDTAK